MANQKLKTKMNLKISTRGTSNGTVDIWRELDVISCYDRNGLLLLTLNLILTKYVKKLPIMATVFRLHTCNHMIMLQNNNFFNNSYYTYPYKTDWPSQNFQNNFNQSLPDTF